MGEPAGVENEENRQLRAILYEWYRMFVTFRKEGTEGAVLLDRTFVLLQKKMKEEKQKI
jgi:hypothetical protein